MSDVTDEEIRELHRRLIEKRAVATKLVVQLSERMVDCEIALSHRHQAKDPRDPDYPTFIAPARERVAGYLLEETARVDMVEELDRKPS